MKTLLTHLAPYLRKYRWYLFWGFIFIIISNIFTIYPAQVVRLAFNLVGDLVEYYQLIKGFRAETQLFDLVGSAVLLYGGLVLGLALLRGFFLFLVRQTLIVMSRKVEYEQKNKLYHHYQSFSLSILRRRQTGDLMARITDDVTNVRMFTGPGIMYTLNTLTLFAIVLTTMLAVNIELTFYVLIPMPVLFLSIYFVHSIIIKRSDEVQSQLSNLTSYVQEAFSGIRLLKAYGRERHFKKSFVQESDVYRHRSLRLVKVDALFFPLILLLIGASNLFIVFIGGLKVISGSITIGNIAEFMIYVNLLIWPIAALGWITSMIQKAAASQIRINQMLALVSELEFPRESQPVDAYDISFRNVSFTYNDTGIDAMKAVSLEIPAGSVAGVVGPTGSGKSSAANLLLRLMDPDEGEVCIGGNALPTYSADALRGAIAYVPQDVFLFSDTIRGNIAFGKADAEESEIIGAAKFAGVFDDIMDFPKGFDTKVGERGVTLSGGQKQRISIARAYLLKAKIIILDDSLSAVDTKTEELILKNLRSNLYHEDYAPTLLIITHRISTVKHADRVFVMNDGQLVEQGSHEELLKSDGIYARMHFRQQLEEEISAM